MKGSRPIMHNLQKQINKNLSGWHFSTISPCLFLSDHLSCLSHRKTRWIMLSLKICIFEDLGLHDYFDISSLV
jgi:hypothetical protein